MEAINSDTMEKKNGKPRLPLQVLLDYADNELSTQEISIVEEYLKENPDDLLIIEGVEHFYKEEQTDREGLESFLAESKEDMDFLWDHLKEPEAEPSTQAHGRIRRIRGNNLNIRKIHSYVTKFAVACLAILFLVNRPDIRRNVSQSTLTTITDEENNAAIIADTEFSSNLFRTGDSVEIKSQSLSNYFAYGITSEVSNHRTSEIKSVDLKYFGSALVESAEKHLAVNREDENHLQFADIGTHPDSFEVLVTVSGSGTSYTISDSAGSSMNDGDTYAFSKYRNSTEVVIDVNNKSQTFIETALDKKVEIHAAPASGKVLKWNGTQWIAYPTREDIYTEVAANNSNIIRNNGVWAPEGYKNVRENRDNELVCYLPYSELESTYPIQEENRLARWISRSSWSVSNDADLIPLFHGGQSDRWMNDHGPLSMKQKATEATFFPYPIVGSVMASMAAMTQFDQESRFYFTKNSGFEFLKDKNYPVHNFRAILNAEPANYNTSNSSTWISTNLVGAKVSIDP